MSFEFNIAGASADGSDGADGPNDEPKKSDAKPEHTELDAARAEFGAFFRGLEKTINGYYGTGDIAFTIKPGGWYVDLEKITVNADPEFFLKKGYSKSEALFATFHEAEHFRDMTRDSKVYKALFDRFKANAAHHPGYPKALQRLYNCLDDVLVNNSVMQRWNAGVAAKDSLYPKLFPSNDLSVNPGSNKPEPRFRQFMYALLRESMLPNEPCIVSDEVREVLDRVQKQGGKTKLTDLITAVDESGEGVHQPADRFEIIQGLIEPAFLELFKKDVEDRKNQKQKEKREKGEPGEPSNNEPFDDDPFEDAIPDPIDFEDLEKEMKKITDAVAKKKADAIQKALGVSQEDYDAYKKDFKIVEKFIENLSKAFDAVIERRKTYQRKLRRPVVEGVVLSPARIATAVAEIKTGNMDSRAMLDYEEREMIRTRPSDLEFTLVCDGSGSMKGNQKEIMQRRLAIMVTEALAAFQERIEKARRGGDKISLDVSSEVRIFDNDDRVVKPLGVTLTHKERVAMHQQLRQLRENQSNNEVATFEGIRSEQFNKDRIEKLQKGDVKKVILFLTDGESDTSAIQAQIASLERLAAGGRAADSDSLVIAGIGFEGGESVRTTYAPNGYYAESFDKISDIFEKFLEEILDKL